jgi:hypothetical protein
LIEQSKLTVCSTLADQQVEVCRTSFPSLKQGA